MSVNSYQFTALGGLIVDKDSASVREKLQKDLQSTKSALEDIKKEEEVNAATNHEHTESTVESTAGEQGVQHIKNPNTQCFNCVCAYF